MKCFTENKHTGRLETISRMCFGQEEEVVKWCPNCGTIVIDLEVDGRIYPGKIMKMQFPKIIIKNPKENA
jgi:hypothetical protein